MDTLDSNMRVARLPGGSILIRPRWSRSARLLAALLLAGSWLAGCSDPPAPPPPPPPAPVLPPTLGTWYFGQEVWLTYQVAERPEQERTLLRGEGQAQAIVENLRARVLAGEDLGRLARQQSNARGGVADGFVVLPVNPDAPEERDLALMRVREGEVTPIVRWRQGFWFARRIGLEKASELKRLYEEADASEARGQAIVVAYTGSWPYRHDERLTRAEAEARAQRLLARLEAGEDFAAVARQASSDLSGDFGGHLRALDPVTGQRSNPWIRLGSTDFPVGLVNHLLRGEEGRVWPEVLDTSFGFVLVKPLERRRYAR